MEIQIFLDNKAKKELKKLPSVIQQKVFNVFEKLEKEPIMGIPLKGEFKGFFKIRVGEYRIVYKYFPEEKLIVITRIRSRQGAYK